MKAGSHVLVVTRDDAIWQHWRQLANEGLLMARGDGIVDIQRWQAAGRTLVVVDSQLALWDDTRWAELDTNTLRCIAISTALSDVEGQAALVQGARGYVHAYASLPMMTRVIEHVAAGELWVGASLLSRLLNVVSRNLGAEHTAWQTNLTPREIDVAQRAAMGHSNQLIASDLGITERTVRAHLSAVFEKLDVADRLMLTLKVHGIQH